VIFGGFLIAHLATHTTSFLGGEVYDGIVSVTSAVYQQPVVEAVIIGSVAIHAALSIQKMVARWTAKNTARTTPSSSSLQPVPTKAWQTYTGYFSLPSHLT